MFYPLNYGGRVFAAAGGQRPQGGARRRPARAAALRDRRHLAGANGGADSTNRARPRRRCEGVRRRGRCVLAVCWCGQGRPAASRRCAGGPQSSTALPPPAWGQPCAAGKGRPGAARARVAACVAGLHSGCARRAQGGAAVSATLQRQALAQAMRPVPALAAARPSHRHPTAIASSPHRPRPLPRQRPCQAPGMAGPPGAGRPWPWRGRPQGAWAAAFAGKAAAPAAWQGLVAGRVARQARGDSAAGMPSRAGAVSQSSGGRSGPARRFRRPGRAGSSGARVRRTPSACRRCRPGCARRRRRAGRTGACPG